MRLDLGLIGRLNPLGIAIIFLILGVFVLSIIVALAIRGKYFAIQHDLENKVNRKNCRFRSEFLNKIVENYKSTALINYNEVNTQAIIENCFNMRLRLLLMSERFVKHTVSMLITLGLLGTFLGLTVSVGELATMFRGTIATAEFTGEFMDGLVKSVYGMGVAFTTSLFGIACSIIFTIFSIIFNAEEARETLMVHIEEYLDNSVSLVIAKDKETEYTIMNKILRDTFIEFGEKIENTLKETVENFGNKLSSVVMDVNVSSKALDSTVDKFDQSLKSFADNIKDFTEFNDNLRNNIEKMDVSFIKVTEALTTTSKIIVDNYSSVETFSKDIKVAAEEITSYNRQVIQDVGNIVSEVKGTVSSINELSEVIKNDLSLRSQEVKEYQDKINQLMLRLSEEIEVLGQKTVSAFSQSLDENGRLIAQKVVQSMDNVLKEVFVLLDQFKENEKLLAKTIVMLPDQVITYNETAAAQVGRQLDEVKRLFRNHDGNGMR